MRVIAFLLTTLIALGSQSVQAAAMRPGFDSLSLVANDDGSTGLVGFGFGINFYGNTYTQGYLNNNGNITFNSPLSTFTPFGLTSSFTPIIAPFFADVDTRGVGSALLSYGTGTVGGRNAFGVTWNGVGYFSGGVDKLNKFQVVLIDRGDTGAGNFDIEFNYDQVQWETGGASGGSGGLGGNSVRVGYSNGSGVPGTFFELAGSGVNGALLDGGPLALISNQLGASIDRGALAGQYTFQARNGRVINPAVPEPSTILVWSRTGDC